MLSKQASKPVLSLQRQSCHEAFRDRASFPPLSPPRFFFFKPLLSFLYLNFTFHFLTPPPSLSVSICTSPASLSPPLSWCHSAHLGCLLELGTSVPVRGAQWGPVEDTKGGLLQLPVTLRPTQQLLRVYSSVLNPHTQPHHKGTSLARAQRRPTLTPS